MFSAGCGRFWVTSIEEQVLLHKRRQHLKVLSCEFGRNERIRTSDPFVPNGI
jgi:hypothetical protein